MSVESSDAVVGSIIAAIQQLNPAQRRQLQRRLRVSGLLVPENTVTDQDRLRVAPALGMAAQASHASGEAAPSTAGQPVREANTPATPAGGGASAGRAATGALCYRSPVSGKVVVGGAAAPAAHSDPHAMLPLPGQAPEQPIQIVFDGGSKGNPGVGYGSYRLTWPGSAPQVVRLQFGDQVTNNEAEYDTLIAALEACLKRLRDHGADPRTAQLDIRGDSLLVVNQVQGKWQVKEGRLRPRCERARQLLAQFGVWRLRHHDRSHSVDALGH